MSKLSYDDKFLSTPELAKFTGTNESLWESRRMSGDSPPFIRLGHRSVRYRWKDVQEWLENRFRSSTSDAGTKN